MSRRSKFEQRKTKQPQSETKQGQRRTKETKTTKAKGDGYRAASVPEQTNVLVIRPQRDEMNLKHSSSVSPFDSMSFFLCLPCLVSVLLRVILRPFYLVSRLPWLDIGHLNDVSICMLPFIPKVQDKGLSWSQENVGVREAMAGTYSYKVRKVPESPRKPPKSPNKIATISQEVPKISQEKTEIPKEACD